MPGPLARNPVEDSLYFQQFITQARQEIPFFFRGASNKNAAHGLPSINLGKRRKP
jgi:hypothetical protein